MKTNQYNEPDVIFLQLHDPTDEGKTELADPKADGVTWCWEQIHHNDVEYIRKDLYDELKTQITAYQLTIENMESARKIPKEVSHHDALHYGETDWCRGYNACIRDMLSARKGES